MKAPSHKRINSKRNSLKILIPLLFLAIISLVALFVFDYLEKPKNISKKESEETEYDFKQYFVPVCHFTSQIENLSFNDLKANLSRQNSINLILPKENNNEIKDIFKIETIDSNIKTIPQNEIIDYLRENKDAYSILPTEAVDFRVKSLAVDGINIWDKDVKKYSLFYQGRAKNKKEYENQYNPNEVRSLTVIGDVILGRTIALKMAKNGYNYPFLKVADKLKKSDITFANLETPLSDLVLPPYEGMNFIAPTKTISGLLLAGIDVVGLANNHSTNFGTNVFLDNLSVLTQNKIKYCGGGKDKNEARSPAFLEVKGLKFAFLDYNSIVGAIEATENSSGTAEFDIKPWSEVDNREDIELIKKEISEAKKQADLAVVMFHWGTEYTAKPIQSQVNVAHAAYDAGANLVVGTHPHWVQEIEFYESSGENSNSKQQTANSKFIAYSLGNFVFDQEWSVPTKQGVILETVFYHKKLVSVKLVPIQIEDYSQPRIMEKSEGKQVLDRIFGASAQEFQK